MTLLRGKLCVFSVSMIFFVPSLCAAQQVKSSAMSSMKLSRNLAVAGDEHWEKREIESYADRERGVPVGFTCAPHSATCVVCLAPFLDPVTCTKCGVVVCRDCVTVTSGRCCRCKCSTFRTSTSLELRGQFDVTCNNCRWTGLRDEASHHQCRTGPATGHERGVGLPERQTRPQNDRLAGTVGMKNLRQLQMQQCLSDLQRSSVNSDAWFNLGMSMRPGEDVYVGGTTATRVMCFTNALHLAVQNAVAWEHLGLTLGAAGSESLAQVNGQLHNRRDCFLRALQLNPDRGLLWYYVGRDIPLGEHVVLVGVTTAGARVYNTVDGMRSTLSGITQSVTRLDCVSRALQLDNGIADAYAIISEALQNGGANDGDEYMAVNGAHLTAGSAARIALSLDLQCWRAWRVIGERLCPPGEAFQVSEVMAVTDVEALELGARLRREWEENGGAPSTVEAMEADVYLTPLMRYK